jgi:hypothetical protein
MIFLACKCGLVLRVSGNPDEVHMLLGPGSDLHPDRYPCPESGHCMVYSEAIPNGDLRAARVVDVTPQEAFAALHGAGLPSERDCGETAVRALLLEGKIAKVDVQQLRGTNRSVVRSLQFEDGRRLYLGSGPEGAVAYRIAGRAVEAP